jgi:hypothetical protein
MAEETNNDTTDTTQDNTDVDQTKDASTTKEAEDSGLTGDEIKTDKTKEGLTSEDDDITDDKVDKEDDAKKDEGAPEVYEAFTLKEGFDITDDEHEMLSKVFKKLDLSKEKAQEIIDLKQDFDIARQEQLQKDQVEEVKAWQTETRKELGTNYDAEIAKGKKAYKTFIPEGFRTFLEETGLVHHPDFIRGMIKIGNAISEDSFVKGKEQKGSEEVFKKLSDIFPQPPVVGAK